MSTNLINALIGVGIIVCIGLIVVIVRQLKTRREHLKAQKAQADRLAEGARQHRRYLIDSIQLIAGAVLNDEKMTITEGCIRLKVLLDNLAPHLLKNPEFSVIETVYGKTEHIPFLEQWKALPDEAQEKYSREMAGVEATHRSAVTEAMRQLRDYPLEQMQ